MLTAIQQGIEHNKKCQMTRGERLIKQKAVQIGLPPKKPAKYKKASFRNFDSTVAVTNYSDEKIRNHLLDKKTNSEGESVEITEMTRKEDERKWTKKRETGVPEESYKITQLKSRMDKRKKFRGRMIEKRKKNSSSDEKKSSSDEELG